MKRHSPGFLVYDTDGMKTFRENQSSKKKINEPKSLTILSMCHTISCSFNTHQMDCMSIVRRNQYHQTTNLTENYFKNIEQMNGWQKKQFETITKFDDDILLISKLM